MVTDRAVAQVTESDLILRPKTMLFWIGYYPSYHRKDVGFDIKASCFYAMFQVRLEEREGFPT